MSENINTDYKEAIEYLRTSPMFNLSLSSKELFHSNFLYWIWKLDSTAFKCLIAKLLNVSTDDLEWGDNWEVAREYKSFDLCVKDKSDELECYNPGDDNEGNKQTPNIYLVIENKVKSIPYKAQLSKYVRKIKEYYKVDKVTEKEDSNFEISYYGKNYTFDKDGNLQSEVNGTLSEKVKKIAQQYINSISIKYLLLTLPTHFPDAPQEISSEGQNSIIDNWEIVTYNKYINELKGLKNNFFDLTKEDKCYEVKIVDDYIEFVNNLLVLHNHWEENCYEKLGFLWKADDKKVSGEYQLYIKDAENLRIHDLYHKSKYARICTDIIAEFNKENVDIEDYEVGINLADKDIFDFLKNTTDKKGYIVWEYNYMHGQPLVGVKITRRDKDESPITYIIQVQAGVYEHGIIADHTQLNYGGSRDEKLWEYVKGHSSNNIFTVGQYPWMRCEEWNKDTTTLSKPEGVLESEIFGSSPLYPQCKKPYLKYAGDGSNIAMIYQFRNLKIDVKTDEVIRYIIDDVKQVLEALR